DGLLALAEAYATPLAGGDLAEAPLAVADIVLVGAVRQGRALLRSGARAGDLLYVTGNLGGAAAGLVRLGELAERAGKPPAIGKKMQGLLAAHLLPRPRIAQGLWLQRRGLATAALDLSDGLSTDLEHLCEESGVDAEVDAALLPLHPAAAMSQALHGGEDYELLFATSPEARIPRVIAGVEVTRIGRVVRRQTGWPEMTLVTAEGRKRLERQGWEHFA
ncbi:MAG TPA: thiamine-phosphate kinase, partial [Candidatus Sulfopaludibacter sp.]|nr:thiamine-phosphate kinase [Candidatus Sulfopaludibacter sp.]